MNNRVILPNGKSRIFHVQSFGTGSGYVYIGRSRVYGSNVDGRFVPSNNTKHAALVAA